jgi:hypothetical protein
VYLVQHEPTSPHHQHASYATHTSVVFKLLAQVSSHVWHTCYASDLKCIVRSGLARCWALVLCVYTCRIISELAKPGLPVNSFFFSEGTRSAHIRGCCAPCTGPWSLTCIASALSFFCFEVVPRSVEVRVLRLCSLRLIGVHGQA